MLVVAATMPAAAQPGPPQSSLWDRAAESDEREIAAIVQHAQTLLDSADRPVQSAGEDSLRQRMLADARGMLLYALRRAPDHPEVLERLAYVEEAAGRVSEALRAYERYLAVQPRPKVSSELCTRHGVLLGRTGAVEDAIARLGRCVDDPGPMRLARDFAFRTHAIVQLACLHAHQGRITAATELLLRHTHGRPDTLVLYTLAVIYDMDEQITRAFDTLDQLASLHGDLMLALAHPLNSAPFIHEAERSYFMALLLEIQGHLPEAREQWHNYMRSGDDARHARRARAHILAIDALVERR